MLSLHEIVAIMTRPGNVVFPENRPSMDALIDQNGKFRLAPDEMVFREKPSRLIGPDGQPVNW